MTETPITFRILLVEDDPDSLELLSNTLPTRIGNYELIWDPCGDFDEAVNRVSTQRYDLIVTDIYRDRAGEKKGIDPSSEKANDIITRIRGMRFSPILAFTDGSAPQTFQEGPFIKLADKSGGNDDIIAKIEELLDTGIPTLARKLHDELDRATGSYLWGFLESNWSKLKERGVSDLAVLERLARRRAALQLGRLQPESEEPREVANIEGLEFYICPPIAGNTLRLGEILLQKEVSTDPELTQFVVVLTPHCHLTIQNPENASVPRASYVLTVRTVRADALMTKIPFESTKEDKKRKELRRRIQSPPGLGSPDGRYWFLPGFLDIPDLYCDFLRIESVPYAKLKDQYQYEEIAVLDTPFAEAMQMSFTRFYSAVGLPSLDPDRFNHLLGVPFT